MTESTPGPKWAYEDFVEGVSIPLGPMLVTADEIVAFASEFDPQPMHLDEEAGRESILGGLSASGWHTCALFMRMLADAFIIDSTAQGAPGVDYCRWKRPVLAGDTLSGQTTVVTRRLSRSRPELGLVTMQATLANERGETVFEFHNTIMFLARGAAR